MKPSSDPASEIARVRARLGKENRRLDLAARLLFPKLRGDQKPRRILLYRTARLGDFIVAIPAMVALRETFPDAEIVLLSATSVQGRTDSVKRSLAGQNRPPWFDFVAPSVIDRAIAVEGDGPVALAKAVQSAIREFRPDVAIVLCTELETFRQKLRKLLFFRSAGLRAPIVGYRMRQTHDEDVILQQSAGMLEHNVVSAALSAYECPGMPLYREGDLAFKLHVEASARGFAQSLWQEQGWSGRRVVVLFPGGSKEHNYWPVGNYAALLGHWPSSPPPVFVTLGTEADRPRTSALIEASSEPIFDLTGKLTLMQTAAVLEKADLYLGTNTGPMHLSTALGTRTIAIMNHHELIPCWEPWNDRRFGLVHEVPCKGCYSNFECPLGTAACIRDLPVRQVREAVRTVMAELP